MTTATTNTVITSTNDAEFRTWITELSNNLDTVGSVRTAATGQINLATATKPTASNTTAGYEIRRMNDTLQSTKPVFWKIEYGIGTVASNTPCVWITIGTVDLGNGSLGGLTSVRQQVGTYTSALLSTTTNYKSLYCVKDGFIGVEFKRNSQLANKSMLYFTICRTVNSAGEWTGDGVHFVFGVSSTTANGAISLNFNTSTVDTSQTASNFAYSYGNTTSTLVSLTPQCFRHFHTMPLLQPSIGSCSFLVAEATPDGTTTFKTVGATARTYIVTGHRYGLSDVTNAYMAFLWE